MAKILRVEGQTEPITVRKKDGTEVPKSIIRLKELGNDYADEYVAAVLGNLATVKFEKGELVAAELSFSAHENNGAYYQDVLAKEVVKLKK